MNEEEKEAIEQIKQVMKFTESLIDKLEKENEELYQENKSLKKEIKLMKSININENFISKDKIREILGLEENISNEKILDYIELLIEENNRLEDIEDRKVEVEYKNVFNKGVISVKDKIRNKIKELEEDIEVHSIYEENWNKIEVLKELLGE